LDSIAQKKKFECSIESLISLKTGHKFFVHWFEIVSSLFTSFALALPGMDVAAVLVLDRMRNKQCAAGVEGGSKVTSDV
jgi:hypothetical protein